ncbi:INO80 complex subunit E [Anopheles maculipalpis]|uniref:INO80 complex subunit E n=1 Tax=Anopheles maculipalpis TaxID=1496333 RepID=UPI00215970DC|nr:INO80 complex subunit E [Anopheles maculipalpis]
MIGQAMRQTSDDFLHEIFGMDDMQVEDAPTSGSGQTEPTPTSIDYRKLYNELRVKSKTLIRENEYLRIKLKTIQSQLFQIARDRNYLLDQLLTYQQHTSTPSTSSSSSETDAVEDEACATTTKSNRSRSSAAKKNRRLQ